MSKEMDELLSYFKTLNEMDEGEMFNGFNEMYKNASVDDLRMKIEEVKLQNNNAKLTSTIMALNKRKTGNEHLDTAIEALTKSMGIDKAIELSDLTIEVNKKLGGVLSSILATRELMNNVTDEGEDGGPEDDTTD